MSTTRICCVVEAIHGEPDEMLEQVVKHCVGKSISCAIRGFDSWKYNHDRDNITMLPAIHIYRGSLYQSTIYLHDNPIDYIDICIQQNRFVEEKLRKRNEAWAKFTRLFSTASSITAHPTVKEQAPPSPMLDNPMLD